MRIITGSARGRNLKAPPGEDTRPTSDRLKETMFNILQFSLEGRQILDLFAGSGQLGLEALSRGARDCVFVDMSGTAAAVIKENIKHISVEDRAKIVKSEAIAFLLSQTTKYDVIFLDPPYRSPLLEKALHAIASRDILCEGGFIMAECDEKKDPPVLPPPYILQKQYNCGNKRLLLYSRREVLSDPS